MGADCCKPEQTPMPTDQGHSVTPFQLAAELTINKQVLRLQEDEIRAQRLKCEAVLSELQKQRAMLQEIAVQVDEAREDYTISTQALEVVEQKMREGEELSQTLDLFKRQCEEIRGKLHALDSVEKEGTEQKQLISTTKAEVASLHSGLKRSHAEIKRFGSGHQQQPEVFEFSDVLRQSSRGPGQRLSSLSRLSKETRLTAEEILLQINEEALNNNILISIGSLSNSDSLQAYDYTTTKLIISALFKEKGRYDALRIEENQRPHSFPDFLVHMMVKSSTQGEGPHHVAMLMKSIKLHYERSEQAGILFAKLFQLYHKEPIGYQFAVVAPHWYDLFGHLAESRLSDTGQKGENFHLELDDRAWMADVLDLLYKEFGSDSRSGGHLLLLLKPSDMSSEDYHHFCILHRLTGTGKTPEKLMESIGDGAEKVEISAVARGLKRELDLWITEYDLQSLLQQFDQDNDGELSLLDLKRLTEKSFSSSRTSEKFSVKCVDFMFALEEVAMERNVRMATELIRTIGPKDVILTPEDLKTRLERIDPEVTTDTVSLVYAESRKSKEEVWVRDVVTTLLRFPIGDWSRSPLSNGNLLALSEGVKATTLLANSGNIIEEQNEED